MRLKFKNPPINEVAIGVYFDNEIQPFRTEHVGLFWAKIRDQFPNCRQQPIITPPIFGAAYMVEIQNTTEASSMPRYLFESTDGVTVVQVQKNAFLFNWRKREAEYPHFASVKEAFDKNYAIFSNFLEETVGVAKLEIQVTDLTYINIVDSGSPYWQEPKDTSAVLPAFSLPANLKAPVEFQQTTKFTVAPDLLLYIAVRNGKTNKGRLDRNPIPILLFELRALGVLGSVGKGQADEWFSRAHDVIGNCFLEMTSTDIQERFWEKT